MVVSQTVLSAISLHGGMPGVLFATTTGMTRKSIGRPDAWVTVLAASNHLVRLIEMSSNDVCFQVLDWFLKTLR